MGLVQFGTARPVEEREAVVHFLIRAKRRTRFFRFLILSLILLPSAFAALYYGVWASDRYVSEARYIVRGLSSSRISGLEVFFRTFGISRTVDDTNAVQSYILSRDAVRALDGKVGLRRIFSRREADIFARFPRFWRGDSFEQLYGYYLDRVAVIQDAESGVTTLKVSAFRPEDSQKIAAALLGLAEQLVNRMNVRAQSDAVAQAERAVSEAEQKLVAAQSDLTNFRNRELVVDPSRNSASVLDTITSLTRDLVETEAQIQQARETAPGNPALPAWQAKADALQKQIAAQRSAMGGTGGALANSVSAYERLSLMRELAEKSLTAAEASLEQAREDARRQQIYVEQIVAPNLPDKSTDPQRLRAFASVLVACFGLSAMIWILFAGAREHAF